MRDALGENKARELAGGALKFVKKYLKDVAYLKRGRALGVSNGHEHHEEYLFPRDDFTPKSIPSRRTAHARAGRGRERRDAADGGRERVPVLPPLRLVSRREDAGAGVTARGRLHAGASPRGVGRSRSKSVDDSGYVGPRAARGPPREKAQRKRARRKARRRRRRRPARAPATSGTPADHPGSARGCDAAGGGEGIPADPGSTETDRGYPSRSSERRYAENVSLLTLETARLRADLVRVAGRETPRESKRSRRKRRLARTLARFPRGWSRSRGGARPPLGGGQAGGGVGRSEEELRRDQFLRGVRRRDGGSRAEADPRRVSEECAKLRASAAAATAATASTTLDEAEAERLGEGLGGATAARARGFSFEDSEAFGGGGGAGAAPADEPSASRGSAARRVSHRERWCRLGECVVCMEAFEGEDERARAAVELQARPARRRVRVENPEDGQGEAVLPDLPEAAPAARPERHVVYT